ncbi:DNA-3-methyladenine glycosylase I [marine gamma proteobacterium HTCC2207]|jgi:DNA-3-methyladenine glycosylase I|uniref:DNA-3-methyladenine glycosylase I n=1 Tax=gamma proteobacterium HTCC2207 TaxID=314287 RepID=Q1YUM6_9GAMM|nr:DNA-3-methyladenine glycosylase I [marine gamma proteobacterium HTCC2207] [gamma proteobacterium HTCC2207]MDG1080114.1 DNA-3-methyladenine glycosylase I [Porticoccaceae bacterium]MDG1081215.1 DNA-3-methyladenine glycosylase I [Porticoccaceae bacterium]
MTENKRCAWCGDDPLYQQYHDREWGVPCRDDQMLFEFVVLEGAQAGLSWITILRKRESYRQAFANFDVRKVAAFDDADVERLLKNPGIVRNRLKVASTISNARHFIDLQNEHGSFSNYIWGFVDNLPIVNHWSSLAQIPASTELSDKISKEMKKRGFKFFGTTICYAFLQAVGVVNDHTRDCFRCGQD